MDNPAEVAAYLIGQEDVGDTRTKIGVETYTDLAMRTAAEYHEKGNKPAADVIEGIVDWAKDTVNKFKTSGMVAGGIAGALAMQGVAEASPMSGEARFIFTLGAATLGGVAGLDTGRSLGEGRVKSALKNIFTRKIDVSAVTSQTKNG